MSEKIIGWDIGGAHVKAAALNSNGEVLWVSQQACPLWKGVDFLDRTILAILQKITARPSLHVITMTGELVDCFPDRLQGVKAIIDTVLNHLPDANVRFFAGSAGILTPTDIQFNHYMQIASANWLASASLAAKHVQAGLFVDIGSTTTDILLIENHKLQAIGYTDYERLVSGELLYTGVIRTAVMAVAQRAEFNGKEMGLMAEYFATMADVYRLTGDLQAVHDQSETADGGDKSLWASVLRLSRMTGYEFAEADWPLWGQFALYLKDRQKDNIGSNCLMQLQKLADNLPQTLVGAGVGRFLLKEIAGELNLAYVDFADLFKTAGVRGEMDAGDCAPAVAVACLGMSVL
jgi:probable H4MPT-linked C1 transfer pathway protein